MRSATPATMRLLKGLLAFLGIGAIGGGGQFIIAPDGHLLGIKTEFLARTPFSDYLIPGIILLVVIGIGSLLNAYCLDRQPVWRALDLLGAPFKQHWAFTTSLVQGIALFIWISYELVFLGSQWLMYFYLGVSLAVIALTLAQPTRAALTRSSLNE